MAEQLTIFTDGGARGNPGPAAIGFVIKDSTGKIIHQQGEYIGQTTNNVAEYRAVIAALKWVVAEYEGRVAKLRFFLDSALVVNQLNGLFKIKEIKMRNLVVEIRQLEKEAGGNISYQSIPRKKNFLADGLVNQTLDQN